MAISLYYSSYNKLPLLIILQHFLFAALRTALINHEIIDMTVYRHDRFKQIDLLLLKVDLISQRVVGDDIILPDLSTLSHQQDPGTQAYQILPQGIAIEDQIIA